MVPENPILGYPIRDRAMNENIYNGSNWYKTHCKDLQWFFTTGSKIKNCFLMTVLISKIRNTDRYEANIFLTETFYLFKIFFFFVWSYSIFISTNSSIRDRDCFVHHVNDHNQACEKIVKVQNLFFLFFNFQYAFSNMSNWDRFHGKFDFTKNYN